MGPGTDGEGRQRGNFQVGGGRDLEAVAGRSEAAPSEGAWPRANPSEGAGPGELGPSAAVPAAASDAAPASPPPLPRAPSRPPPRRPRPRQGRTVEPGPGLSPAPAAGASSGRIGRGRAPQPEREADTRAPRLRRPPPPPSPLPSPPLRPPASAAAGGRTLSDQPGEPRSIPIRGERRDPALQPARLAPGPRKWLAACGGAPTLARPLPHRQRSPAGPRPRRAHSQRGARAGDARHGSGGGRGCCWYCHRCHGRWPGPGLGTRGSAVGLNPQPRPPSLKPLLCRAPGLLSPRLHPRSWSQAGSPGPAPRPGPCMATEPRGAPGLLSPNTRP